MSRTVTSPVPLPNPNVNGGMQIVGTSAGAEKGLDWARLQVAVNSLYASKIPCLVVDTHDPAWSWMGSSYNVGAGYKHFYRFPYPMGGLTPWLAGPVSVYLRGVRATPYAGGTTSWRVDILNAEDGSRNAVEVNGGLVGPLAGNGFVWHAGDFDCIPGSTGDYGELDIFLETFGGALGSSNYITSLLIIPKVELSAGTLPAGLWGTPDTYPLFALDPALWGAALDSAHAGMIATCAALLEDMYRRRRPTFLSVSRAWGGGGLPLLRMWNNTATMALFAILRVSELLAGCPGVGFLIYVEDSKYAGDGTIKLTAGANTTTIPNVSLGTGTWCSYTTLNCKAGDVVKVEANHIKIGTIMVFGAEATL
jgi:hypothetical protein